ncbi:MAG: dCMP deaminase family protein [Elusimicrobia bacterium]|nr:dCMP deaminase family protein [Elusimicrobiota bacterium]
MGIALAVRRRANCRGSRVGAIVVVDKRIVSTGYNGTPEGMTNCLDGGCDRCANRTSYPSGTGYDLCICVHAEQNSILAAARFGISVSDGTVYTTTQPCFGCVKEMLQAKIKKVFYLHPWIHPDPAVANEYRKIVARIPEGLEHLDVPDPDTDWARNKSSSFMPIENQSQRTKSSLAGREKWVRPPRP